MVQVERERRRNSACDGIPRAAYRRVLQPKARAQTTCSARRGPSMHTMLAAVIWKRVKVIVCKWPHPFCWFPLGIRSSQSITSDAFIRTVCGKHVLETAPTRKGWERGEGPGDV